MSEETKAPETKAPETKAPETKAPEVKATTEAKPAATETPAARTAPATTSRPASTDRPSRPERPRRPGGGGGFKKRGFGRRKTCFFCDNKKVTLDYKDGKAFRPYITERGKILPRRTTGTCAKHQRFVSQAIKRARNIAVLPYSTISLNT